MNPSTSIEVIGLCDDPIVAYKYKKLYEEYRMPFCVWNSATMPITGVPLPRNYGRTLLLGYTKNTV